MPAVQFMKNAGQAVQLQTTGASNCWLTDDNNSLIFTPYAPAAVRPAEKSSVRHHRHAPADIRLFCGVARRQQHRFALRPLGQDPAPGIDDGRMAERLPAPWVDATLSGRQQVALGLDGAGADQHLPVRRAGHRGERRRRCDQLCAGLAQRGIEFRKTQVVADRQAKATDRRIRHHDLLTESIVVGFTIAARASATSTSNRCSLS